MRNGGGKEGNLLKAGEKSLLTPASRRRRNPREVCYEPSQPELDRIHAEKLERLRIKGLDLLTPEERKKYG